MLNGGDYGCKPEGAMCHGLHSSERKYVEFTFPLLSDTITELTTNSTALDEAVQDNQRLFKGRRRGH